MKNTINKSQLMKRAWDLYRNHRDSYDFYLFKNCLRRAWEIEKSNIAHEQRKFEEAANEARFEALRKERSNKPFEHGTEFYAGMREFYTNARRGQYMGD